MLPVTLNPAALETFYQQSENCKKLLRIVEQELARGDSDDWPAVERGVILAKLCIETLLKHQLTSRQLATFDVLNALSDDNSQFVRDHMAIVYYDIDEVGMTLLNLHAKTVRLLVCVEIMYMRATLSHDIVQELHTEYMALANTNT